MRVCATEGQVVGKLTKGTLYAVTEVPLGVVPPQGRLQDAGGVVTTTLAEQEAVPPVPVTVPVYVVVFVGDTFFEPLDTGESEPTLWLTVNDVAFVVVYERLDELPVSIDVGVAESVHVGAGVGGGVIGVISTLPSPPELLKYFPPLLAPPLPPF